MITPVTKPFSSRVCELLLGRIFQRISPPSAMLLGSEPRTWNWTPDVSCFNGNIMMPHGGVAPLLRPSHDSCQVQLLKNFRRRSGDFSVCRIWKVWPMGAPRKKQTWKFGTGLTASKWMWTKKTWDTFWPSKNGWDGPPTLIVKTIGSFWASGSLLHGYWTNKHLYLICPFVVDLP